MREHLALTRHQAARWTARVRDSGGAETLLASPRLVPTPDKPWQGAGSARSEFTLAQ
jgi:hypothetical protein